jgi:hypothetical protein
MITVISTISISTGGVLRLSKKLLEKIDVSKGDRLVILKENPSNEIILQFQRKDKIIFGLKGKITYKK